LAVPAIAIAAPDAELIKLAETYERLFRIRAPLVADYNEKWGDGLTLVADRVGWLSGEERTKKYKEEMGRVWVESGAEAAHEKLEPFDDQLDDLAHAIMDAPVHTPAGLRAKVALVVSVYSDLWDEPFEELDWEKRGLRRLIEAACSLGGFPLPTETMGV
jgi:hypothetical protein